MAESNQKGQKETQSTRAQTPDTLFSTRRRVPNSKNEAASSHSEKLHRAQLNWQTFSGPFFLLTSQQMAP
jgi:hypothetical protein